MSADYGKNVVDVYADCTRCLLSRTSLPYVLSLVGKTERGVEGLPSWIPDYSVPLRPKPFSSLGCPTFEAASLTHSSYSINNGNTLCLSAAEWDTIANVGESSEAFSLFEPDGLRGYMLNLVTAVGKLYSPTGELAMTAFWRTLTADVLYKSTISPVLLVDEFVNWIAATFFKAEAKTRLLKWTKAYQRRVFHLIKRIGGLQGDQRFDGSPQSLTIAIDEFVAMHSSLEYSMRKRAGRGQEDLTARFDELRSG